MTNQKQATIKEIVKPMERGQITIPIKIRKKLDINPNSWLWIKLTSKNQVLIEPVKEPKTTNLLANYLKTIKFDKIQYWTKKDSQALKKVKQKSKKRLETLAK
jgi:AbrB family looped-hinge helix DNA binding protein